MFTRELIANRGEIAVRVIRTLTSWASRRWPVLDRDRGALRYAARRPGGLHRSAGRRPELPVLAFGDRRRRDHGLRGVHPGYGFLAENPAFVRACAENDLVFVGPGAEVMEEMGDRCGRRRRWSGPACRSSPAPTAWRPPPTHALPRTTSDIRCC